MGSLRNPVGSLPSTVYWRRRVLVLLAVLVVLALILYACSDSGSGKKKPAGNGKTSPTASQSSLSQSGSSSASASGGPSGSAPGTSNVPSSSAGAPSGSSAGASSGAAGGPGSSGGASGGASGGTTGGAVGGASGGTTGGASGGTTGGVSGAPVGASGSCQLSLLLTQASGQYANGDHPSFTVTALNKGTADCDVDLSPKSLVLTVYSGSDRIWSSADCTTAGPDIRGIAPGTAQTVAYSWDRVRSSPGCPAGGQPVKLGNYFGVVSLAAGTGPNAPSAQSQPKVFELKSGS
ncbi:MAG: hypothetical protein HOV87_25205 [Catenulispora sp.]|nr:hypothetical protein [Catenulispora sp.]